MFYNILIFRIKYCPTEFSEQPVGRMPALNVMAMRDWRHANVSKQRTAGLDHLIGKCFHSEMNFNKNASFI